MTGAGPAGARHRVVVVGMGSEYRRDDGAGPAVADEVVRSREDIARLGPIAEPLDLLGLWDGADLAVVIDAVHSDADPGTVQVIELDHTTDGRPEGGAPGTTSTHGIGLAAVLRLARAVDSAPQRVVVVGIEGDDFGQGTGLTPAVGRAVPHAARHVIELIEEVG